MLDADLDVLRPQGAGVVRNGTTGWFKACAAQARIEVAVLMACPSLELLQEAQIAFEEQAQVVDAIAQHGQAIWAQAEGEADVSAGISAHSCAPRSGAPALPHPLPASAP